jgi:hypothetical protein
MNSLPLRCAALIGWVICLTEMDRRSDLLQLNASAYLLLLLSAAILVVPALRRVNTLWVLAAAFPVFCALELLTGPLDLASAGRSLIAFTGAAITIALSSRLARELTLAEDAVDALALGSPVEPAAPFSRTQGDMFREIRRARRHERPLSLLAVSARGSQPPSALAKLLEEARRESMDRFVRLKLKSLLDEQTAGSAVIAEREGHFLVLLPEAERQEAERVIERIGHVAAERHGIGLRFGIASFPHQEITFDKLIETAETELRALERDAGEAAGQHGAEPRMVPSAPARG